jgi:hypothetical protein
MKLYDVPGVERPLLLDETRAEQLGYSEHVDATTPKRNASKQEWVDYAVQQGADPESAASSTKSELVAEYGG